MNHSARPRGWRDDRGDVVLDWLVKVSVTLAILGVIVFDGISAGSLRLRVQDAANSAAFAAATNTGRGFTEQQATDAANQRLAEEYPDFTLVQGSIRQTPNGGVQLQVKGTARTVVMKYIGPLKKYASTVQTGVGTPSP